MNILIFSGYYLPGYKGGGPIKTIKNLVESLDGFSFSIVTKDRDLGEEKSYSNIKPGCWNKLNSYNIFYTQPRLKGLYQIINILISKQHDVIYLNSFFSLKFSLLPLLVSKITKQQVIIGPRGEFSSGALKLKTNKKNAFIQAYKILNLSKNVIFQASSTYEAEDIRRVLGSKVDIIVAEDIGSQDFTSTIPKRGEIINAVFISRISPKKNLSDALKILKSIQGPLIYNIYGPIEDRNYWQLCQSIITELPANITVQYKGELTPDEVITTLSSYDFFFMPTKGENYGHVIAEALCAGLPLVISNTTPWQGLESLGIGWDLPLDNLDVFSKVIDKLTSMSDEQHYKMRESVLAWAKRKFAQRDAIEANTAMFKYAYNKKKGVKDAI